MSENPNHDILLQEHFKYYISEEDQIIFEHELNKAEIRYYQVINSTGLNFSNRYYFLKSDDQRVADIIDSNGLLGGSESHIILDHKSTKIGNKIYFIMLLVVMILTCLIALSAIYIF